MKITIITTPGEYGDRYEEIKASRGGEDISIRQLGDFEGQAEEALFTRDIRRPSEYLDIIEMAFKAGKNNEFLDIQYKIDND